MSDNPNKKNPLTNLVQGLRASQEQAESLTTPMFEQIEHLGRIAKALANPFGESIEPTANTPTVIEHKPPMPNHHNSPALRTLTSIATAKDDEKTEKQILLKIIERLIEKPANETSAKLAEMPLVANTLTLQASEITSLKDQLDQKEQKINELQAQIDQLQATATPANYALSVENSSYTTQYIDILNAVIQEFWINHQEHHIPPKQDTIIKWIVSNYSLSTAGAKAIEQVARPDNAKTGGVKSLP